MYVVKAAETYVRTKIHTFNVDEIDYFPPPPRPTLIKGFSVWYHSSTSVSRPFFFSLTVETDQKRPFPPTHLGHVNTRARTHAIFKACASAITHTRARTYTRIHCLSLSFGSNVVKSVASGEVLREYRTGLLFC